MTDNFEEHEHGIDDFVETEVGASESSPRAGVVSNLVEAWRTKPLFKFMILLIAVFAVGVAAFSFLGHNTPVPDATRLARPPGIKEPPGGAVSPYMREQTEMANKERSDQAAATGGSALPTPIGQTTDVGAFGNLEKKEDPLNELRIETEKRREIDVERQFENDCATEEYINEIPITEEELFNQIQEDERRDQGTESDSD